MPSDFSVKIYGCRGSLPISGTDHARYGGATSCVVITAGSRQIVLDAGSGITTYGNDLCAGGKAAPRVNIFVSHAHFDHIIGLPYFTPMYRPDATVHLWGPRNSRFGTFEETIDYIVQPPYHPVALWEMLSRSHFHDIGESEVVYFLRDRDEPLQLRPCHPDDAARVPSADDVELSVHCMRGYNHPKSGVNIYKVVYGGRSMVYATDTEGYVNGDRRLIEFARGAELLIHDAMYTEDRYVSMPVPTQGYGHSTVEIATALAMKAGVRRLALFHHDPVHDDAALDEIGELGRSLFEATVMARDGLEFEL